MSNNGTLIHYGELALKKKNRGRFIRQLAENIEKKAGGKVSIYEGRLYMEGGNPNVLKDVFGISWYAPGYKVERGMNSITEKIFEILDKKQTSNKTFGLFIKRSDKRYKPNSAELARILGQRIVDRYSMGVDLDDPDIPIHIEIAQKAFLRFTKTRGSGGLPVGITGSVLSMLSGGIDSPVSSYLMMRRGCDVDFIHFHTYADNSRVLETKIPELARKVGSYGNHSLLYLVPYKIFQIEILKNEIPRGYEMLLFRSFMFRLSGHIAKEKGYKAVVTGDCLAQVASQTIENLAISANSSPVPVFQPLISFDKEQIIDVASRIDTYDISIKRYKECCSILSANPKTQAAMEKISTIEDRIDMEKIVEDSLAVMDQYEIA